MKCGNSKGGSSKTRSSGGTDVTITKTKARVTSAIDDHIVKLRAALFTPSGADKDCTAGLAPILMNYKKNGLDLSISFSAKLSAKEREWAFDITKDRMENVYEVSG